MNFRHIVSFAGNPIFFRYCLMYLNVLVACCIFWIVFIGPSCRQLPRFPLGFPAFPRVFPGFFRGLPGFSPGFPRASSVFPGFSPGFPGFSPGFYSSSLFFFPVCLFDPPNVGFVNNQWGRAETLGKSFKQLEIQQQNKNSSKQPGPGWNLPKSIEMVVKR